MKEELKYDGNYHCAKCGMTFRGFDTGAFLRHQKDCKGKPKAAPYSPEPQVVCLEPNSTLGCLPTNEFRFTKKGFTNRTGKFPSPSTPASDVVCKNNPCSIRPDCPSLKPHTKNNGCVDNEECPDCIPVPSTLNEEITGGIKINGKPLVCESTPASVPLPPDEHEHADGTIHSHRQGAYAHIHKVGDPPPR